MKKLKEILISRLDELREERGTLKNDIETLDIKIKELQESINKLSSRLEVNGVIEKEIKIILSIVDDLMDSKET